MLLPSVNVLFVTVLVLLVDNISAPPNVAVVASIFATSVPNVIERLPVEAPVNEPVPNVNLSSDSSNPINALSALPLSITKPASLAGVPEVPFANSIRVSDMTELVVARVVVVPLTVKLPVIVASPATDNPVSFNSCNSFDLYLAVTV